MIDLSKKLEIEYFNKFIGKEVTFLPEIEKDGYKIGHTGNYLLIKTKSDNNIVKITKIDYPYCIGE